MIHVLFSDKKHPGFSHLERWCIEHEMGLFTKKEDLPGGDTLFCVSCTEILNGERKSYRRVFVIHESDLPKGRGWSPLAWQVLEGKNTITVSLLDAADQVDSGDVFAKDVLSLEGHELADEIHAKSIRVKTELMEKVLREDLSRAPQCGEASYYKRRTPEDSRLDPHKTLAEQFDLLRICDARFPAFFELRGHRYQLAVSKA